MLSVISTILNIVNMASNEITWQIIVGILFQILYLVASIYCACMWKQGKDAPKAVETFAMVMCILNLVFSLFVCVFAVIIIISVSTQAGGEILFVIVIPAIAALISIVVFLSYY